MTAILARLFPKTITNVFPGQRIALWLFVPLTALTVWRSQHHIFAPDGGAQTIATIPLDSYTDAGAAAVITIFALWGLSQLLIGLLYLIALIRYRALIPLLYLLFTLEYAVRLYIGHIKPIETAETAPGAAANLPFAIAGLILLALSLWPRRGEDTLSDST